MDLLTSIGSVMDPKDLKFNQLAARGEDIVSLEVSNSDYFLFDSLNELSLYFQEEFMPETNFFSLENWDNGLEGMLSDAWFKFVQFVKRIVRTIKTAITHFITGVSRRLRYFKEMKVEIRGKALNWEAFYELKTMAYTYRDFEELIRALNIVKKTLNTMFGKQDFDLDSIMDFREWGITFVNGAVYKNEREESDHKFDLGYTRVGNKTMYELGWRDTNLTDVVDKFCDILEYDIKKDYDYVRFQSAMDTLIRDTENSKSTNGKYEEIRRLHNIVLSVSKMVQYCISTTWNMGSQLELMLRALQKPSENLKRSDTVYG